MKACRAAGSIVAAALAALSCASPRMPVSMGHPLEGGDAPPFHAESTQAREVAVPAPTAVTVLDFWASWCASCRESLPALDALYRERKNDGVMVIGICLDEDEDEARALLESIAPSFPMVSDPNMRLARAYRAYQIPLTFVIDREGVVRWAGRHPGQVRAAVDALLAEGGRERQ